MLTETIGVATDGYIASTPYRPLSVWTRGYLTFITVVTIPVRPRLSGGGGGGFEPSRRTIAFEGEVYKEGDKQKRISQAHQEDEEILHIIMISTIYGFLE